MKVVRWNHGKKSSVSLSALQFATNITLSVPGCLRPSLQHMSWSVFKDAYHLKPGRIGRGILFDVHAHVAHHPYGSHILRGSHRYNPLQVKLRESVVDQGLRRFCGVSLTLIGRGKGIIEAEFRRVQVGKGILM